MAALQPTKKKASGASVDDLRMLRAGKRRMLNEVPLAVALNIAIMIAHLREVGWQASAAVRVKVGQAASGRDTMSTWTVQLRHSNLKSSFCIEISCNTRLMLSEVMRSS